MCIMNFQFPQIENSLESTSTMQAKVLGFGSKIHRVTLIQCLHFGMEMDILLHKL